MSAFKKINGLLHRGVTLLSTSYPTLRDLKDAVEAAEKLVEPYVELETSYEDTSELSIGGWVPANVVEAAEYDARFLRIAEAEADRDMRLYESLKARFEPGTK